jgi:hypothetical protein
VRIEDPKGRILQARLTNWIDTQIKEHRYYYEKKNGVAQGLRPNIASYTGVFGPANDENRNQAIDVNILSISQLVTNPDSQTDMVQIKRLPKPNQYDSPLSKPKPKSAPEKANQ